MLHSWELLNSTDAFHNRWLHVTLDTVRLPDGHSYEYTTIRRDSVGVAAVVLNEHNQLLLEQEYRHPVGEVAYQLPGGLNATGEDPVKCIRRDSREETGVLAGSLVFLGRFWNNPATSNGECLVYLCREFRQEGASQARCGGVPLVGLVRPGLGQGEDRRRHIRDRVVICGLAYLWLGGMIA